MLEGNIICSPPLFSYILEANTHYFKPLKTRYIGPNKDTINERTIPYFLIISFELFHSTSEKVEIYAIWVFP